MSIIGIKYKSAGCISLSSSSDESMKYCQHYLKLKDNNLPNSPVNNHWKTLSNFLVNVLSVTLRNTIDPFQTGWWKCTLFTFSVAFAKVCVKLAWQMKTYFCFLLVPPVFTFLMYLFPAFFLFSSSHLSVPLFIPFPSFFTFPSLSCTPFFALLSTTPFYPLSHLLTSLCRSITEPLESVVSQSAAQVRQWISPPSGAQWHGALLSPSSVGAGQSGTEIGRCRSRFVWRDHHTGTSSACNVGWHTADRSTMGAGSKIWVDICTSGSFLPKRTKHGDWKMCSLMCFKLYKICPNPQVTRHYYTFPNRYKNYNKNQGREVQSEKHFGWLENMYNISFAKSFFNNMLPVTKSRWKHLNKYFFIIKGLWPENNAKSIHLALLLNNSSDLDIFNATFKPR